MPDPRTQRKVLAAGMIGTLIEYFDFLVYATVSGLVFGKLFFPTDNEFVGAMLAISTFAVGFLVRPIGGIVFGHIGDRYGRRRVLSITITMMGIATALIGVLPTYSTIGIAAPIILVILRITQGLGVGGEYGAASTMVIEHADQTGRRGLFGGLNASAGSSGFLLATGLLAALTTLTTDEQFEAWGWRVPFLLSAVLLAVGFYIRYHVPESPVMRAAVEQGRTVSRPLLEAFRHHPRQVAIALAAPTGSFVGYYVILVFSAPYAANVSEHDESALLALLTVGQIAYLFAVVGWAWWSDKVGRRLPMLIGSGGLMVWGFVFFPLLLSGSLTATLVAFSVALVLLGAIYGPLATFLAELFGTEVRLSGLSFGFQVSGAWAGGLSPVIATALVGHGGTWLPVAFMIAIAAATTVIAVWFSKDGRHRDLRDSATVRKS
ncbi:hypothetical protein AFA91_19640 [Mycolicibacterium goodii]|uniref:Putative proline/betaine transporter n=1 Tax=Mycolicibacterium goodii TaxID=134601 RepID=A0A0K0X8Q7_MYCGD|nr:hypothetical protein AFA91_19640 [Mycolicibacterium goodii]